MMYEKQEWRNKDVTTPISAQRLTHLEDGVADSSARVQHLKPRPLETVDVAALAKDNHEGLRPEHPYEDPSDEQVQAMKAVVDGLLRGDDVVAPEGTELLHGWDEAAKREVHVLRSVPGNGLYWGVWVFPVGVPLSGVIEAPHPVFDAGSDDIAARVWAGSPAGTVLAVAGSHRTNPDGKNPRDVCKNTKSMWHQITTHIAQPGLPELQLHGFADENMPEVGAVVSSGSAPLSAGVIRVEAFLANAGVATARQWDGTAKKLIGMLNAQGDAAAVRGNPFCHVEMSKTTRDDHVDGVVDAFVSSAFLDGGHGALITNEFPKAIGSLNSRGKSAIAARADHVHKLVQNEPSEGDVVVRRDGGWRSVAASEIVTPATGSGGGYQKPVDGIPLTDLTQELQDAVAAALEAKKQLEEATYSATANTIMKRTSKGAVSVAEPTANAHAANKGYVDKAIAKALQDKAVPESESDTEDDGVDS